MLSKFKKAPVDLVKAIPSKWQTILLVSTASFVYFLRAGKYILQPQLYADDGNWLQNGYNLGVSSLALPLNGFAHFPERLFGFLVGQLPLHYAPFIFNLSAWLIFALLAYYLLTPRTKILSNNYERIFVLLSLCLIANVEEFFFNFSNSIFLLGIIGLLIITIKRSSNRFVRISEKIIFLLSCLTLPFAWFYLPVTLVERFKYRQKDPFFLYAASLGSVLQLVVYLTSHVSRSAVTLPSLLTQYTFLEIYNQIIMPAVRFARADIQLGSFELNMLSTILTVFLVIAVCSLATVLVLRRSRKEVWYVLFFLAAMTFASIKSPTIPSVDSLSAIKFMAITDGGDRYFIFGILGLNLILAKFTYDIVVSKARYAFMAIFMAFGFLASYHAGGFIINKHFSDLRAPYHQSVNELSSKRSDRVFIPINPRVSGDPTSWTMELKAK